MTTHVLVEQPAAPPPLTRRQALAALAGAQKSSKGAPGYSRWVNRRLGRRIAASAFVAGLTPNQVTAISGVFTFTSIAAVAAFRPSWYLAILVTLGLVVGYAFDSADGQLARLRGGGSAAGEWLDHVLDGGKASAFHLALAVSWFRFYDLHHAALLLVPLGYAATNAVLFFAVILTDVLRRIARLQSGAAPAPAAVSERAPVLRSLIVLPSDYGVLCLVMLLLAARPIFVSVYAALLAANVLALLVSLRRWFREMKRL